MKAHTRQPITAQLFRTINRDVKSSLRAGTYRADRLGEAHGVSPETVRCIRRAGSWPKYEAQKQARRVRRVKLEAQAPKQAVFKLPNSSVVDAAYNEVKLRDMAASVATMREDLKSLQLTVHGEEVRLNRIVTWVKGIDERTTSRRWFNRSGK